MMATVQNIVLGTGIAKAQVANTNIAGNVPGRCAVRGVRYFGLQVQNFVQTIARHGGALEQVDDEAGHAEWFHDHVYVHEEGDEVTHGHAAVEDLIATVANNGEAADGC
jgi:hypothetical protein